MDSKNKRLKSTLHQFVTKIILNDFDISLDSFEKHLKKIQNSFDKKVKAEEKNVNLMTDEEEAHYQAYIDGEYERLGQSYPQSMRRGILLALYSFCESRSNKEIKKVKRQEIELVRHIRNILAHQWGKLGNDDSSKKVRGYINRTPGTGISISSSNEIIIGPNFIKRVINIFKKYFKV